MPAKRILVFAPYGAWMVHHQVDAVIGAALAHRGCEVLVVGCDGVFDSCFIAGKPPNPDACRSCAATGAATFARVGLKVVQLRELLTAEDREAAAAFAGAADLARLPEVRYGAYPLGQWCPPSMQGYFTTAGFNLELEWVVKAMRGQIGNGVLLVRALNRLLDEFRPDHVFAYNGTHFYYRIASELAKERGLKVLVHERGHLNDSFTLLDGESTNSNQGRFDAYEAWKDVALTDAECREVEVYFREREEGKNGFSRFYAYDSSADGVRQALRIPAGATVLALFGSGDRELDAFGTVQRATFRGQLEWIRRTAEICRQRGWYLVVRHHPSNIMKNLVNYPFLTGLMELNRDLPDCARVIMPHEKLTSYALLWNADGAVTHFSTMGSETPTRGVVGVCVGDSLYLPLGVEWAGSPENYERALIASVEKTRDFGLEHLRRAYRGAHYVVFKLGYKFRSFGIKDVFGPEIRFRDPAELGPGNDPILDRVCDHVMEGRPLLPVPGAEDAARGRDEETRFLERVLDGIKARRQAIKSATQQNQPAAGPLLSVICGGRPDASGIREKSLARSRERRLERLEIGADPEGPHSEFLPALLEALRRARGSYLYLAFPGVDVDESVFSTSVDFLERKENAEFSGVSWGCWMAGPGGKLESELFTETRPARAFEDALQGWPGLERPARLLSLAVLRKSFLEELIGWLEAMSGFGEKEIAASLFGLLNGGNEEGGIKRMGIPMLSIYPAPASGASAAAPSGDWNPGRPLPSTQDKPIESRPEAAPVPGPSASPETGGSDWSPAERRRKLEEYAQAFSRDPGDVEAGLACAGVLVSLGEAEGARRVYRTLLERRPGEARIQPLLDGVEWKARQGQASVQEWSLRGRGYEALRSKASIATYEEAQPYVESVPGWMIPGQEKYLFDKVKSLPDGAVILEMGADRGRSTAAMALACKGTAKRIFSIDTFAGNDGIMGKTYDFYHEWHANLARLGVDGYVTGLQGYTFDVLPGWNTPVDFAFIDASHEYVDVVKDLQLTYPHVKPGGWIAFHDVEAGWPGPWRVWLAFGKSLLSDWEIVHNLAGGRKRGNAPFESLGALHADFSFARAWKEELSATFGAAADPLVKAMDLSLEGRFGTSQEREAVAQAESAIGRMPEHAPFKQTLRHMLAKDARLDGHLLLWNAMALMAEGKWEDAYRDLLEATRVSRPVPAERIRGYCQALRGKLGPAAASLPDPDAPSFGTVSADAGSGGNGAGHYGQDYFNWQKNIGAFGGVANLFKFRDFVKPADTVVDMGSGGGYLLRNLRCARKLGVEINPVARREASIHAGIDSVERPEDLPDGFADVIVSNHALEHVHSPLQALRTLRGKLKPGGKLVLVVPNDPPSQAWDPGDINKHLFTWNPMTLGNLVALAGYRVLQVEAFQHQWPPDFRQAFERLGEEGFHAACREQARRSGNHQIRVVAVRDTALEEPSHRFSVGRKRLPAAADIPVALMTYKRPEHTAKVLRALEGLGVRDLRVFSDGPRSPADREGVEATRRLVRSVPWAKLTYEESAGNRGLARSIMHAADSILAGSEFLVLLEDDCVPQKHFMDFMARCLDKYRDNPKVYGISGYTVPLPEPLRRGLPHDAYFFPRIGSWGWATWKRAWTHFERDLTRAYRAVVDNRIDIHQGGNDVQLSVEGMLRGHVKDVWTMNWILTVYARGGVYAYPRESHVQNIGFDGTGVHCGATTKYDTVIAERAPAVLPDEVAVDPAVARHFRSFYDVG